MRLVTGITPSPGMAFCNEDAIMTLAAGLTCLRGDILSVVRTTLDSSLRWTTVREPLTADFATATTAANVQTFMCVALEDQTTAAGNVRCRFVGVCEAKVEDAGTPPIVGDTLTGINASRALDVQATATGTGERGLAILLELPTVANSLRTVMFDGLAGVLPGYMVTAT